MDVKPPTEPLNFGELILTLAKNAEHITPKLQDAIASYIGYQCAPAIIIGGQDE